MSGVGGGGGAGSVAGTVVVLMNAASGVARAAAEERERLIREALEAAGVDAEVRGVEGRYLTREARAAVEKGATAVVASGGDGTVSAVASAVAGTGAVMGVLPMGTLNHFAKDVGIPLELAEAARVIAGGQVREVDVADVNGRVFVNNASIGIYPTMVRRREEMQQRLGHGKWWAMVKAGASLARRHPLMHLRIDADGRRVEQKTPFVFVGNNNYDVKLFAVGRRPAVDRGELCLYFTRHSGRLGMLRLAIKALLGRLTQDKDFEAMCLREVRIESLRERLWVGVDGEVVGMEPPLVFRSRGKALRVLAPGDVEKSGPAVRPLNEDGAR